MRQMTLPSPCAPVSLQHLAQQPQQGWKANNQYGFALWSSLHILLRERTIFIKGEKKQRHIKQSAWGITGNLQRFPPQQETSKGPGDSVPLPPPPYQAPSLLHDPVGWGDCSSPKRDLLVCTHGELSAFLGKATSRSSSIQAELHAVAKTRFGFHLCVRNAGYPPWAPSTASLEMLHMNFLTCYK